MEKSLKDILPIAQNLEASYPLSDILTEEEKAQAIQWEIEREVKAAIYKMNGLGYPQAKIDEKLKSIDWMKEINADEVIKSANERKHWKLEDEEYKLQKTQYSQEKRKKEIADWTAASFHDQIKGHFKAKHGRYILNDTNKHYITTLCYLFSNDPRFQKDLNYSFNKGLMIIGTAGLGKTETLKAIANNPISPLRIFSLIDISEQVRETGACNIAINQMTLLDDVGTEPEVINHYGTKITWFKDFIESYYLKGENFNRLIVTTNCGGDELQAKYGYRVRSRTREMFNILQMNGEDMRG